VYLFSFKMLPLFNKGACSLVDIFLQPTALAVGEAVKTDYTNPKAKPLGCQ